MQQMSARGVVMEPKLMTAKEYFEKLEWLSIELQKPADITIHTQQAKHNLSSIIYTTVEMLKIINEAAEEAGEALQ